MYRDCDLGLISAPVRTPTVTAPVKQLSTVPLSTAAKLFTAAPATAKSYDDLQVAAPDRALTISPLSTSSSVAKPTATPAIAQAPTVAAPKATAVATTTAKPVQRDPLFAAQDEVAAKLAEPKPAFVASTSYAAKEIGVQPAEVYAPAKTSVPAAQLAPASYTAAPKVTKPVPAPAPPIVYVSEAKTYAADLPVIERTPTVVAPKATTYKAPAPAVSVPKEPVYNAPPIPAPMIAATPKLPEPPTRNVSPYVADVYGGEEEDSMYSDRTLGVIPAYPTDTVGLRDELRSSSAARVTTTPGATYFLDDTDDEAPARAPHYTRAPAPQPSKSAGQNDGLPEWAFRTDADPDEGGPAYVDYDEDEFVYDDGLGEDDQAATEGLPWGKILLVGGAIVGVALLMGRKGRKSS